MPFNNTFNFWPALRLDSMIFVGLFQMESLSASLHTFPCGCGSGAQRESWIQGTRAAFVPFVLVCYGWWALEMVEQKINAVL